MSIRTKLLLFVLCAFLANILLVYGYYNLFFLRRFQTLIPVCTNSQAETDRITEEIENRKDFEDITHHCCTG